MAARLHPSVAISVLNNLVWDFFDIALTFWIGVFATNQTLGGEKGVLWIDDSLTLC